MDELSRRTLLGAAGAVGAGAVLAAHTPAAAVTGSAALPAARTEQQPAAVGAQADSPADSPVDAALAALRRLLPPEHAGQFRLRMLGGAERFRVTGSTGRIEVAGTSAAVLLTGVHWYLKYVCRAHISWSGSQLDLPRRLPAPRAPLERAATVAHRFAYNDTHDGYTAPYADWPRWERLLDVLALHGCNEVLVTPGQEAVYHRLLRDFGYSDTEARTWLPAPSHQPWWLLQNMSEYGGPMSTALIERRTDLGRRIADRMRELGMRPVLPGYFGTVPDGFAARNPGDARVIPQGTWNGLRRPDWLDPRTRAFAEVAAAFYRHQAELFGEVDHFKMDLLHEGGTAGDVPVPDAARAVERALRTARPDATWVILGWQANPRPALLDAIDTDRVLIVDGLSDLDTVTDRESEWGGAPYAFGTIPNFGGRTTLGANTDRWTEKFTAWRDKPGSALAGTAYMPEAAERDPAALELFSELAWREEKIDREAWFAEYAHIRYGGDDRSAREAFAALAATAYRLTSTDGRPHDSLFCRRPSLTSSIGTAFDPAGFDRAFAALLDVRPRLRDSDAYRHDLTDLARQALANRSRILQLPLRAAHRDKDADAFRAIAALWVRLMRLSDTMAGCHRSFLLGPWLEDAKRLATSPEEAVELERTARSLITTWADRAAADQLSNYANRDWQGLINDVHVPQWEAYLTEQADAMAEGRAPKPFDWYPAEEAWTKDRRAYPVRPTGDAYRTARRVYDTLARAPYQGFVSVRVEPAAFTPGSTGTVTASFRNLNGLRATGRVDLELTGLDAEPQGAAQLPGVPAGGSGEVAWRVTAPDEPLTEPLVPMPYVLTTRYGPEGEERVAVTQRSSVHLASPLDPQWRTFTSNVAVFGQLGDRLAINGAGNDLWRGTTQFGAAYREGALGEGGSVLLRVVTQENTGSWARAGIVVRNALAKPGDAGFLNLAVTPGQGVVMSYDTGGDGTLDTYRRITGIKAPVLLRLTKHAGAAFTGACSTDGGATWRTVAKVTVAGAAARQDTGFFMSAANGGSGARGTVRFSGWSLTGGVAPAG
ncbi:alpha-N-acetylglucosaminidase C-terminal domain-containing protein [Streptomyces sp. ISL-10]|uniref:alpha-N-acetylglucosaminidase n=1 Tax=Streptomyces sp. ISL-10 TaxID=2819172 RepID=UPI001BE52E26|nr:alpha-N-acetylglucosaminidase TIM-barrel domain-containing protein [Streptomyces sp. ISL-10]MBT2366427.1 alpha-N-acetylglucosaminidase C-terminal domain-containing protein [Streptomyces sp. ISL-10]